MLMFLFYIVEFMLMLDKGFYIVKFLSNVTMCGVVNVFICTAYFDLAINSKFVKQKKEMYIVKLLAI